MLAVQPANLNGGRSFKLVHGNKLEIALGNELEFVLGIEVERPQDRRAGPALQFAFEGFVEDGGQQGVEFGGGFGLQFLERVCLCLKAVEVGHDAALLGER